MKYSSVVMERIYTSLTQGLEGGCTLRKGTPFVYLLSIGKKKVQTPEEKV